MGSQIYADKKMQYYPTSSIETMRILCVLDSYTGINKSLDEDFRDNYSNLIMDEFNKSENNQTSRYGKYRTNYLCSNHKSHKYINANIENKVVADLFSGEGNWLKLFKTNCNNTRPNILIGNEIEENRYNELIQEGLIDYHYNLPFEDLKLPKKIINIMLFNPPYGISNGERNVRRYFRMMLDKDIMAKDCVIVMVLKQDDLLNISDLITQYFENLFGYVTHKEEFDKFGQLVVYAKLRNKPLNLNNISDVAIYKEQKVKNESCINLFAEIEFDYDFINSYHKYSNNNKINIKEAFDNLHYINNSNIKISKKDKVWNWLMDETRSIDLSEETITIPKPLKSGELANIIASGKINGEISLDNNLAKHIAVGGVKRITSSRLITAENKKGEMENKQETTIENLPYLNLLINNNGKLEIKELSNYQKESEVAE